MCSAKTPQEPNPRKHQISVDTSQAKSSKKARNHTSDSKRVIVVPAEVVEKAFLKLAQKTSSNGPSSLNVDAAADMYRGVAEVASTARTSPYREKHEEWRQQILAMKQREQPWKEEYPDYEEDL